MQLISPQFFLFWLVLGIVFYLCRKAQWIVLLTGSLLFFCMISESLPVLLLISAGISYIYGRLADRTGSVAVNAGLIVAVILHILLLVLFRHVLTATGLIGTLGISFYTMTSLAYCVDVKRGTVPPEKNYGKLLLVLCFFPSLIQGPIHRYGDFSEELFREHRLDLSGILRGGQRVLWGLLKKLIIVPRLMSYTDAVFGAPEGAGLFGAMLGTFCFFIELYADWSGYMDIMLGISETFGIRMEENFRRPFFSASISEVWKRWHITLGAWFRDYVYIPLGGSRNGLGRTVLGLFVVWLLTGLWHGATLGYLLWGLYFAVLSLLGILLRRGKASKSRNPLRILGIWLLTGAGFFFFAAGDAATIAAMGKSILETPFTISIASQRELLRELYLSQDIWVLLIALALWFLVSFLQEKGKDIRQQISERPMALRFCLWIALSFFVIICGVYGQQYDAASFLYQEF